MKPKNFSDTKVDLPEHHPASREELEEYGYKYAVIEEEKRKKKPSKKLREEPVLSPKFITYLLEELRLSPAFVEGILEEAVEVKK